MLAPPPKRKPRKAKPPSASSSTWAAYAAAYQDRYGVEPIRNARVNGQLARVVACLGADAPHVAEFYLSHNGKFYVTKQHAVGMLLADAESLRTQWATGRVVTAGDAREASRGDEMRAQSARVEAMIRADGREP